MLQNPNSVFHPTPSSNHQAPFPHPPNPHPKARTRSVVLRNPAITTTTRFTSIVYTKTCC
ncbi:hypothetical protein FHU41_002548 [Psychromicrobium silvestre]|uniref:Uncharacterized protein n=1 Tax=Psychromicrobium silvestre TaxID=1645614 RepID=A0A7Y9LQP1_9MICC|nr:hypothetical protein [Psychromicrobium silvestre]NYE96298.1 hypothetical protein [Psychromicrobium silvestre]